MQTWITKEPVWIFWRKENHYWIRTNLCSLPAAQKSWDNLDKIGVVLSNRPGFK